MEAPLALYRRYRPDTFEQVIGQDHVTEPLRAALRSNRVNHAYLLSGPRGCGKTTSARIMARALNCAKGPTDEPCGTCDSCVELATGGPGSIDVIEIDAASHGSVDDARELREQATFQPMRDRFKIYIIDEAHMVTAHGFNALLKIVEEPPPHVRFIFATTEPEKVIGTVRSRTHHYPFRLIPPKVLSAYLADICAREQVAIEPAALPLIVRAGGGSARDSLSVLDQLIGGAGSEGVTHALTARLLGFTPDSLLDEVVDAFAAHDGAAVFAAVDKVIEVGQDPRRFTEDLLQRLRDLVVIAAVPDAPATGLIDAPEDQAERLVAQAARFGTHDLSRAADLVAEGLMELKGTSVPRLLLELLCARVLLPGAEDRERGIAARVDRLEKRLSIAAPPGQAPATQAPQSQAPQSQASPGQASPGQSPPAQSPPAQSPPAQSPPAQSPPAQSPPAQPPLAQSPPAQSPAPQGPPPSEPAARQRPAQQARPPAAPTRAEQQPAPQQPPASGGMTLTDARRLWPDVLSRVQELRKFTWIQLSQHAQVVGLEGGTLTIAFNQGGVHRNFTQGRGEELVRQAVIDLVGQDWTVEAIVDPSAQPGTEPPVRVTRPAVSPATTSAPPKSTAPPADAVAHPDDPAADEEVDSAELLSSRLGAQVIEEIPHD